MKYEINGEYARIRGCAPNDRAAGASSFNTDTEGGVRWTTDFPY